MILLLLLHVPLVCFISCVNLSSLSQYVKQWKIERCTKQGWKWAFRLVVFYSGVCVVSASLGLRLTNLRQKSIPVKVDECCNNQL